MTSNAGKNTKAYEHKADVNLEKLETTSTAYINSWKAAKAR